MVFPWFSPLAMVTGTVLVIAQANELEQTNLAVLRAICASMQVSDED